MKKISVLIMTGILTMSLLTGCGCTRKEEEKPIDATTNTNDEVIKDQEIEAFKFENTSLVYMDGTSTLETTVTNTSETDQALKEFQMIYKDENGDEITTLVGFVGDTIKAGETKVISSYCGEDLTKAASVEYKIVK